MYLTVRTGMTGLGPSVRVYAFGSLLNTYRHTCIYYQRYQRLSEVIRDH